MRLFWSSLTLLAGVFQAAPAMALEFSQRGNSITISGPVKLGDNAKFEEFMAQPGRSDIKIFHLNSNGGTIGVARISRYVTEFAGLHNVRGLDTIAQMTSLAKGLDGKRLRYDDLVAAP